ncbi:MAG: DUF452 family protein [Bacteroidales bacterium]|nr:DUF452 family protein [Bacteroidales bacterium]
MDSKLFEGLEHTGFDIAVAWDYRQMPQQLEFAEPYQEVCVLAWSLGVLAAQEIVPLLGKKVGRCIAVAGTPWPVDDERGIPPVIFYGTLYNLDARNLAKFQRRMCGGAAAYQEFLNRVLSRSIEDLREELTALSELAKVPKPLPWDLAILTTEDGIYPIANQRKAWESTPKVEYAWPHLPDFGYLLSHFFIDKQRVSQRFTEAAASYDNNASVQAAIAGDLWQELGLTGWAAAHPRFTSSYNASTVIEIGPGTGIFTSLYAPDIDVYCDWQLWDIAALSPEAVKRGACFKQCDAEMEIRRLASGTVDYILSNCAVQWFHSPGRFLEECARVLKSGGILAFSTFDPENLPELRQAMPDAATLATPTLEAWQQMLPSELELLSAKRTDHPLLFSTPRDVLAHMRSTGVNALSRPSLSSLHAFMDHYPRLYGGCPLTYISLILVMRRR